MKHPKGISLTCLLLFLAAGCSTGIDFLEPGNQAAVLFLRQAPVTGDRIVMEALYQGLVLDVDGCLRLGGTPEGHTVVWPPAFSAVEEKGAIRIQDDRGRTVGFVGGFFRLGGGEVPTLWKGGPVDADARSAALAQCPGRYWLVGDIPSLDD